MAGKFGIGQPVTRVEDPRFLTGRGSYVDDITFPHQAYGFVLRSPHAHARIRSVDAAAAKDAPGVVLVLTGQDAVNEKLGGLQTMGMPEDMGGPKAHRTVQPVLAHDEVRYVGQPVAFVVAETLSQAKDAAELIEVDYEPLPAVTSIAQAKADGAAGRVDRGAGQRDLHAADGRQGQDRRRLRQRRACRDAVGRSTTASPPTRWSRAPRSVSTSARPGATRCTCRRKARTAPSRRSPARSCTFPKATCASSAATSAAGSG